MTTSPAHKQSKFNQYIVQRQVDLPDGEASWIDVTSVVDEQTALSTWKGLGTDNHRITPTDPTYERSPTGKYVVRLYDGFDHIWMDVTGPVSEEAAHLVWREKTEDGAHHCSFGQIDYYAIFPAETRMLFSTEAGYDSEIDDWPGNKSPGEA